MGIVFTCSIDDGYPSDIRMAALLEKHHLQGTFYVPIKNCEGREVLSPSALREIGRIFEIGSHTLDHCYLNSVDLVTARHQIVEGKRQLEERLGQELVGFCYPGGKYRRDHIALVRDAGFRYARTSMNLCFDGGRNPFEIPTTLQFFPHARSVYLRNMVRGGEWGVRQQGLRLALQHGHWLQRLYALFDYACRHGHTFHLWTHSWEIDELDGWQEMDRFLAYVSAVVPLRNRLTNAEVAHVQTNRPAPTRMWAKRAQR